MADALITGHARRETLAIYQAATYRGLVIAVDAAYWSKNYARLTPARLARELVRIAEHAKLSRYRKHKRGTRKPVESMNKKRRNHISTARVLAKRRPHFSTC